MSDKPGVPDVERRAQSARRVPALFVSHGTPATVFDRAYGNALRRFSARQVVLDGIVVVSAHWESLRPLRVTSASQPELLFDTEGLPSSIQSIDYPCRGSARLTQDVLALFERAGIRAVADATRGFDHGVWVPVSVAYPSARVPVVQVSLPLPAEPEEVTAMGRALAPLRDRNVLLVGSGTVVHNLHRLRLTDPDAMPDAWARRFDDWVQEHVSQLDLDALMQYRRAPHAFEAVPTPEHIEPLFFVLGAAEAGDRVFEVFEGFRYGSLSMRSFVLAGRRRDDMRGVPDAPASE